MPPLPAPTLSAAGAAANIKSIMSIFPRPAAWCIGVSPLLLGSRGSAPWPSSNLIISSPADSSCRMMMATRSGEVPCPSRGLGSTPAFQKRIIVFSVKSFLAARDPSPPQDRADAPGAPL